MFLVVTTPFKGEGAPACLKFLKDKSFPCVWIFVRCPFWICKHREASWFYFISFTDFCFKLNLTSFASVFTVAMVTLIK